MDPSKILPRGVGPVYTRPYTRSLRAKYEKERLDCWSKGCQQRLESPMEEINEFALRQLNLVKAHRGKDKTKESVKAAARWKVVSRSLRMLQQRATSIFRAKVAHRRVRDSMHARASMHGYSQGPGYNIQAAKEDAMLEKEAAWLVVKLLLEQTKHICGNLEQWRKWL